MIPVNHLARLATFARADAATLAALAAIATPLRFKPDDTLFVAGSQPRGWWVVLDGRVRVVRGAGSRKHVVHTEGPGGTLGEVPLFARGTHPATATAAEPTVCALFDRQALESLLASNARVAQLLLERLAIRIRSLVERLDGRSVRSVGARLAEYLVARPVARGGSISIGMTQQALAEELGTVREVISRELRQLCDAGVIASRGGGRYAILDARQLRDIAE
jgi:CRP/FNR family transcriptional regulator